MAEEKKEEKKKVEKKKAFKPYKPGKMCPKCGCRLADHANRMACGRCGYSEFKGKK